MKQRFVFHALATAWIGIATGGCGQDVTLSSDTGSTLCISYYKQCIDPIFHKSFVLANGTTIQCINCHAGGPG